jgi:hypothetical protein
MKFQFLNRIQYKLFILALCCYGAARFCHHQTSGFRLSKITANYSKDIEVVEAPFTEKEETLLQGKFTYFGRGLQSFAFLSEDGTYILKVLNNKMQHKHAFLKILGLNNHAKAIEEKIKRTFESYKIAYEDLKNETAILYLRLKPTLNLKKKAILVDKLGIHHEVDLDQTAFILQKRAVLAYPFLKEKIEQKKFVEAKAAISALVQLFARKNLKGIADNDPLIRTNLGFINDLPVHIDLGPFSRDLKVKDPQFYLPEMRRITASLKHWLEEHSPELTLHLEEELQSLEKNPQNL